MTLNLTIVAPWGIWQCSDHRLTRFPSGVLEDNYSVKSLSLHCKDGTATIAYTGLGRIKNVQVSDWLRKCIRGEDLTLDETLIYIRERANVRLAKFAKQLGIHHTFSIGAFLGGKPWGVQIANRQPTPPYDANPPLPEFHTIAARIEDKPLIMIEGMRKAVSASDWELLKKVSQKRPRKPKDFRRLLATINKRAAKHPTYGKYISPTCIASYISPEGFSKGEVYWWDSEQPRLEMVEPFILRGIDLTEGMEIMFRQIRTLKESDLDNIDNDAFDRAMTEAAKRSVIKED